MMTRYPQIGERLLLSLWVGGLWAIGYLAVPVLFNTLDDRALAGMLAGKMFGVMSVFGLIAGTLLLAGMAYRHGKTSWQQWPVRIVLAMLILVALGLFVLQPMIAELKALDYAHNAELAARFKMLHGISSALYLITSLLGLYLVAAPSHQDQ